MTGLMLAIVLMQTPLRDIPLPSRTGTGVISGVVVTDEANPRPLRRVQVSLESGTLELPRGVVTDDSGRFTFTGLAAANYTLQASRPAYVDAVYGSKKPGRGPGVPIAVTEGQRISGITLKMQRGAVITGVVRLPDGKPLGSVDVRARRITTLRGERQYEYGTSVTTDERGEYRIFGLAPGDYVVQVPAPSIMNQPNMRRMTAAEITSAEALLRGGAVVSGTPAPAPERGPDVRYTGVFFPNATNPAQARVITVAAGQERAGVDVDLVFVQSAKVTGTVVTPDGRPAQGLSLTLTQQTQASDSYFGMYNSVMTRPDGTFSATGLVPGHYVLKAKGAPGSDAAPVAEGGRGDALPIGNGPPRAATLWASEEFDVNGRDVNGLVLRLQPGMSVTGTIVYESSTPPLPDPARTRITLPAVPAPGASSQDLTMMRLSSVSATVEKDGTFAIRGVTPGTYWLSASPPGLLGLVGGPTIPGVRTWSVKSVSIDGRDFADLPLQIKPGEDISGVVITMTDQPTEISGTVFDQLNRPTPGFPIVLFATNRDYWPVGQARVRKVQPASDGKYLASGLPPGEYFVCAVTDVEDNDLKDPAFLESLAAVASKITIAPAEKKVLDLRLGGR